MHSEEALRVATMVIVFPYFFRMKHGIPLVNWAASPLRDKYLGELRYMIEIHCPTSSISLWGRPLTETKGYTWNTQRYGGMSITETNLADPTNRHQAAALLVTEQLICSLQDEKEGFGMARDLIHMFCHLHADMKGYKEITMLNIIGKDLG